MKFPAGPLAALLAVTYGMAGMPDLQPAEAVAASHQASQDSQAKRGLISVRSGDGNFLSWRMHSTDPKGIAFDVYRDGVQVNDRPVSGRTNYHDEGAPAGATYTVRPISRPFDRSEPSRSFGADGSMDVPISPPEGGTTPTGEAYTYTANDGSVGDLDGDGEYEIVLKWAPTNAKDNSQAGFTGNTIIDAYELDGTRLWRIDLGVNIRAGAHYTQFQVFDYDGDGAAEVAMKTADGTVDGTGTVIGDADADHRNLQGYVLEGPEYLTMFDGANGAALDTVAYDPPRGNVCDWGDCYGNRVDRFLAATAYLDGERPSLIMTRGYYTRAVIAAWNFEGGELRPVWTFDSDEAGSEYEGQGNHNLSVADVDGDGRDEIVFGSVIIDDSGKPLWNSRLGHGDALHVGDFLPDRSGLEVWNIHESGTTGADLRDARTGELLWSNPNDTGGEGPGRAVAGDIDPGNAGAEFWATGGGSPGYLQGADGDKVGRLPSSANFLLWWDGDPQRELLDGTHVDDYGPDGETRLLEGDNVASNNGTKATPVLSADLLGDWREEVIWRTSDNTALRIYSTDVPTEIRNVALMEDRQYRVAVAWQNTAYNQPPHPSDVVGQDPGR